LWQGDHTPLSTWIRRKIQGEWLAVPVYASALLDDYSRANPGFWISHKYYDSWSISILYRQAILRTNIPGLQACGIPFYTESDRGADWISEAVQTMLSSLGIQTIIDPAYYPNAKGKVERFFRFMNTGLLATLPGHHKDVGTTVGAAQKRVHELLTLDQLREEINKWRIWYHHRVHSETGRKPIELWEETVRFRYPESEDDLNVLLLKYDRERTILNRGIKLVIDKTKHLYWSDSFDLHANKRVCIRYNPEDTESVLIYCADTGEFLCEAWDTRAEHPRYTLIDVKASRREEKQRLQSISIRTKEYFENVLGKDRLIEQRKEWEEARMLAALLPKAEPKVNPEEKELTDTMEMLRHLKRKQT
jgi:putative transposase